ncbi:hypothetical protein, partial [Rubrivivax gelatinosus]
GWVGSAAAHRPQYSARTAPDVLGRRVLARALANIQQGAIDAADVPRAVHANFAQLIDQNIAGLDSEHARSLCNALSAFEWERLAALYVRAASDARRPLVAPLLLRSRLSSSEMTAVESCFSRAAALSPVYSTLGAGPYLDMTPYEIYLSFRTAPIGSLSVSGSLYESSMLISRELAVAFGIGYAVGSFIAPLIETYAPSLWDSIGGAIYGIVESISSATNTPSSLGSAQGSAASWFDMSDGGHMMQTTGGDYGVVNAWFNYSGGSSGCNGCHG